MGAVVVQKRCEVIGGARVQYGCRCELWCRWRHNRGRSRCWEHRARRRLPMAQTGCCCVWSVDGQTVYHGCAHTTLCQATSWRHGDIAQGGQHHCSRWSGVPSHLLWRGAPLEMVQPPPSERCRQRGWLATRSRGDCGSLFAGQRHHATWQGWCHQAHVAHHTPPIWLRCRGRWLAWRNGWGRGTKCRQYDVVMLRA